MMELGRELVSALLSKLQCGFRASGVHGLPVELDKLWLEGAGKEALSGDPGETE